MGLLVTPGPATMCLEVYRKPYGFEPVTEFPVTVPRIRDAPRQHLNSGRDILRALIHYRMHVELAARDLPSDIYRIRFAGETIIDRWTGTALVGCDGEPAHVIDCGWFACPRR